MNIKPIFFLLIIAIFISCNSKNTHSEDVTEETNEVTNVPATLFNDNGGSTEINGTSEDSETIIASIQVIEEEEFYQKIFEINNPKGIQYKGKLPSIVDFYADWCGPCRAISPILAELAEQYAGEIIIYKVNVEKCPNVCQYLQIESIPALLYLKPNTKPKMTIGSQSKEELQKMIKESLLSE